ncbi:hypothetical protein CF326_g5145 [Tilletia indica]|nr:hypothetical protein CF326_g5145 [Tilletia indica]
MALQRDCLARKLAAVTLSLLIGVSVLDVDDVDVEVVVEDDDEVFFPSCLPSSELTLTFNFQQKQKAMTSRQLRQKNENFVKAARDGKKPVKPAFVERNPPKPAVHPAVLGVVVFVVVGGVFFELLRLFL